MLTSKRDFKLRKIKCHRENSVEKQLLQPELLWTRVLNPWSTQVSRHLLKLSHLMLLIQIEGILIKVSHQAPPTLNWNPLLNPQLSADNPQKRTLPPLLQIKTLESREPRDCWATVRPTSWLSKQLISRFHLLQWVLSPDRMQISHKCKTNRLISKLIASSKLLG